MSADGAEASVIRYFIVLIERGLIDPSLAAFLDVSHVIVGGEFFLDRADAYFDDFFVPEGIAFLDSPHLSISVVPEPAVSGLVLIGFAAVVRRRLTSHL